MQSKRLRPLSDKPIRFSDFYEHVSRATLGGEEYGDPIEGMVGLLEALMSGHIKASVAVELGGYNLKRVLEIDDNKSLWWTGPYHIKRLYWIENSFRGVDFHAINN